MRLRDLFSRTAPTAPSRRAALADQNGRAPVFISAEELQRAQHELIQKYSDSREADRAKAIRDNWTPEQLMAENAEAWSNGKILLLGARSAFSIWQQQGSRQIDLAAHIDDAVLGAAVNEVLSHSREITLTDWYRAAADNDSTGLPERMAQYRAWRDALMSRHGYKTQRAMFMRMRHVTLNRRAGQLIFSPSNHLKIDAWRGEGLPPDSPVIVASDSTVSAIGAALRLTFDRCLDSNAQRQKKGH